MMEQVEQRVGNYRLLQLLGTGAFAEVYLGEHLYLNTPVALKVLRAQVQESTLASFLSEARHVSHLVHPHIIRVFDFGLEAQLPFLVMDYAPFGSSSCMPPRPRCASGIPPSLKRSSRWSSRACARSRRSASWTCSALPPPLPKPARPSRLSRWLRVRPLWHPPPQQAGPPPQRTGASACVRSRCRSRRC